MQNRPCGGDFPPAEDIVDCVYIPKLHVMAISMQGGRDGSAIALLDVSTGKRFALHRPSAPHQKLLVCYHSKADRLLVSDTKRLGARTDDEGVYLLESALYQLHDKETLNLELTQADAMVMVSGLRRLNGAAYKDAAVLADRIDKASKAANPRQSVAVACAADKIAGLLANLKKSAKATGTMEELAVACVLESRVDMAYKHRMNSELRRLLSFRERGWKYTYQYATPSALARAGFFYDPSTFEDDDRTVCFACNTALVSWEPTDQPWEEHNRHYPTCPVLKGLCWSNVPLSKYLASTRATTEETTKMSTIHAASRSNMCVTIGTKRIGGFSGRDRWLTLWDTEHKPRLMMTIPCDSDAFTAAKVSDERYRCSRITARFLGTHDGGEVLVVLVKLGRKSGVFEASMPFFDEQPAEQDEVKSSNTHAVDAAASTNSFSSSVGVLLVYSLEKTQTSPTVLTSRTLDGPLCMCTSLDGTALFVAMCTPGTNSTGSDATPRTKLSRMSIVGEGGALSFQEDDDIVLEERISAITSVYDALADRHLLVTLRESGGADVYSDQMKLLCPVISREHHIVRILCARQSAVLFTTAKGLVVELSLSSIPAGFTDDADRGIDADVNLDTASVSSAVFNHYMTLSKYNDCSAMRALPLNGGWAEALTSFEAGHRTAWVHRHRIGGGHRPATSEFDLTLPKLHFVKDVRVSVTLDKPYATTHAATSISFALGTIDPLTSVSTVVDTARLRDGCTTGCTSAIITLKNSVRGSMTPCQQLRITVDASEEECVDSDPNDDFQVCFSVSCREYDAQTGRRTTYAAGHLPFAKRVASHLCTSATPTMEYRQCLQWLSWIQHVRPQTQASELPLDNTTMASALQSALQGRDVDTFRQFAALLIQYHSSASRDVRGGVQETILSAMALARFNSSALVVAYFDLLQHFFQNSVTADWTERDASETWSIARFLEPLRAAANVLNSCPTLPIRVNLGLNDALLDPNLSEYPPFGWCDVPEISMRDRLGLFDSHRLPLSCGASSPSCSFDAITSVLSISSITSSLNTMVFDCRADIVLTDVLIPQSTAFRQLTIDVWCKSETIDGKRVLLAHPIHKKALNLTGLRFRARFIKIALISYSTAGGTLDCSNIRGLFLTPKLVCTPAVQQRWRRLRGDAGYARASELRRLQKVIASGRSSTDLSVKGDVEATFALAVQKNVTENELRRSLLHCAPNIHNLQGSKSWSPSLAYRFMVTSIEFLLLLSNAPRVGTAKLATLSDCVELFKIGCLYGFEDTRDNSACVAFAYASSASLTADFMESLWELVVAESKCTGLTFSQFPRLVKIGLMSVQCDSVLTKQIGPNIAKRIMDSASVATSRNDLDVIAIWQLDLLGWLLVEFSDSEIPAKTWLEQLCIFLFDTLLDESQLPTGLFAEKSIFVLKALANYDLVGVRAVAKRAYGRFLRQSVRVSRYPGLTELGIVFFGLCSRDSQCSTISDVLETMDVKDSGSWEQLDAFFNVVSGDFEIARRMTSSRVSSMDLPTNALEMNPMVDLPCFSIELSSDELEFTDASKRVKRHGTSGCYPAALLQLPDGPFKLAVRIESSTHQGNSFSFGVGTVFRKDYSDGFGHEAGSIGIIQKCTRKNPGVSSSEVSCAQFSNSQVGQTPREVSIGRRLEAGDVVSLELDNGRVSFFVNDILVASAQIATTLTRAGCTLHTQGVVSIVKLPDNPDGPKNLVETCGAPSGSTALPIVQLLSTQTAVTVVNILMAVDAESCDPQQQSLWSSGLQMMTECCEMSGLGDTPDVLCRLLTKFLHVPMPNVCVHSMRILLGAVDSTVRNKCVFNAILSVPRLAPKQRWHAHVVRTVVGFLDASQPFPATDIVSCILAVAEDAVELAEAPTTRTSSTIDISDHMQLITELTLCSSGESNADVFENQEPLSRLLVLLCTRGDDSTAVAIEQAFESLMSTWNLPEVWTAALGSALSRDNVQPGSQAGLLLTHFVRQLAMPISDKLKSEAVLGGYLSTLAKCCVSRFVGVTSRLDVRSQKIVVARSVRYKFVPSPSTSQSASLTIPVRTHHHRIANVVNRKKFTNMKGPFRRWACDLCDDRQDSDEERHRCIEGCDFDLCKRCSEKDRCTERVEDSYTLVPLKTASPTMNLFHRPVWYGNDTTLRVAVQEGFVLVDLKVSLSLKGCSTLSVRAQGGPTAETMNALDSNFSVISTSTLTRSGNFVLDLDIRATNYSNCRVIDVCFARLEGTQTFEVLGIEACSTAAETTPTLEHAHVWLLALQELLDRLDAHQQSSLLSVASSDVVHACMALIARGEPSGGVFNILNRLPSMCKDAILHVPRYSEQTRYEHLENLLSAMLTSDIPIVANASAEGMLQTLGRETNSSDHTCALVAAVTSALLLGADGFRTLLIKNLQSLREALRDRGMPIVSALLGTSHAREEFLAILNGVVLRADCSLEHISTDVLALLEGMLLVRQSAVRFLLPDNETGARGDTLVDICLQNFERTFSELDCAPSETDERNVPSRLDLLSYLRFFGVVCSTVAGQNWFCQHFFDRGLDVMLAACDWETTSARGVGEETCEGYVAGLLEMACSANREASIAVMTALEKAACCGTPETSPGSASARRILAKLMFGQPRVAAIMPVLGNTFFQVDSSFASNETLFLKKVMGTHFGNLVDGRHVGTIRSDRWTSGITTISRLVTQGEPCLLMVETDADVRLAIVVYLPPRVSSAAVASTSVLMIANLTHGEVCQFLDPVSLCMDKSTDSSVEGSSIKFETVQGVAVCSLSTTSVCSVAEDVLQAQHETLESSFDLLSRFQMTVCHVYVVRGAQSVFPCEPFSLLEQRKQIRELKWLPASMSMSTLELYVAGATLIQLPRALLDVVPMPHSGTAAIDTMDSKSFESSQLLSRGGSYVVIASPLSVLLQSSTHLEALLKSSLDCGLLTAHPGVEQLVLQWLSFSTLPVFRGRCLSSVVRSLDRDTRIRGVPFVAFLTDWIIGESGSLFEPEFVTQHLLLILLQTLTQEHLKVDTQHLLATNMFEHILASLSNVGTAAEPPAEVDLDALLDFDDTMHDDIPVSPHAALIEKQGGLMKKHGSSYWAEGTGFGTGSTTSTWDREKWLLQRQREDDLTTTSLLCAAAMLIIVCTSPLSLDDSISLAETLSNTALPDRLRELLANDSIIDITRNSMLYDAALRVVGALIKNSTLFAAIELQPKFITVADTLLRTADVLEKALMRTSDQSIVERYQVTARQIRERRPQAAEDKTNEPASGQGYCDVLGRMQFDEARVARSHHYSDEAEVPSARCMERLMQELGSLATSLPMNEGSSIFVRYDPDRLNLMKALITGPEGTPYSGGCFEFDLFFPGGYPDQPPKVHLVTTGNGSVRFNPNLYKSGKVCLSILNTWPGRPEEQWSAHCTILQVLMSIQSLILVAEPWFNEPGYERTRGTEEGDYNSAQYNRSIAKNTIRWAMVEPIRSPAQSFERVIKAHFLLRNGVYDECVRWEGGTSDAAGAAIDGDADSGADAGAKAISMAAELAQLKEVFAQLELEGLAAVLAHDSDDDEADETSEEEDEEDKDEDEDGVGGTDSSGSSGPVVGDAAA